MDGQNGIKRRNMKKLLSFLLAMVISGCAWAVTCNVPSSSYTYQSGQTILPNQVQANENNLYTYDQQGVCQYQSGSITQAAISSTAGIVYSQLNLSGGILPGDINTTTTSSIYQFENITVPYTGTFTGGIVDNGTFNLGVTHTGDVLYDNGTSFVRLVGGTAGTVLTSQGNATAPIYSFPSGQVGSPGSISLNTPITATTDGFVNAWGNTAAGSPGVWSISCVTNSITVQGCILGNGQSCGCSMIVHKGNSYQVNTTGSPTSTAYWTQIGS